MFSSDGQGCSSLKKAAFGLAFALSRSTTAAVWRILQCKEAPNNEDIQAIQQDVESYCQRRQSIGNCNMIISEQPLYASSGQPQALRALDAFKESFDAYVSAQQSLHRQSAESREPATRRQGTASVAAAAAAAKQDLSIRLESLCFALTDWSKDARRCFNESLQSVTKQAFGKPVRFKVEAATRETIFVADCIDI